MLGLMATGVSEGVIPHIKQYPFNNKFKPSDYNISALEARIYEQRIWKKVRLGVYLPFVRFTTSLKLKT
jgi:hypothetical protein